MQGVAPGELEGIPEVTQVGDPQAAHVSDEGKVAPRGVMARTSWLAVRGTRYSVPVPTRPKSLEELKRAWREPRVPAPGKWSSFDIP